jgi:hypothetical protein
MRGEPTGKKLKAKSWDGTDDFGYSCRCSTA